MTRSDDGHFVSDVELQGRCKEVHDQYMGWMTTHTDNDRTVERLRSGAKRWFSWIQGEGIDPLDVTDDDVVMYVTYLVGEGYADTTISRSFASVSKLYHHIDLHPRMSDIDNPTADIKLARDFDVSNTAKYKVHQGPDEAYVTPSKSEVEKVLAHPPGKSTQMRNRLILHLFWQTALRSVELARVKAENVDFDEREIQVRSAKLNPTDHPKLYHRYIWWEPSLDYMMHRWDQERDDSSEFFLHGERGEQLDPSYLSRLVKKAARNAGIQEPLTVDKNGDVHQHLWTGHRMRHARISYLANKTAMDLHLIRMFAGHAKLDTTMTYVEPDWDETRDQYRREFNSE